LPIKILLVNTDDKIKKESKNPELIVKIKITKDSERIPEC